MTPPSQESKLPYLRTDSTPTLSHADIAERSNTLNYEALVSIVRCVSRALSAQNALQELFTLLQARFGLQALTLEVTSGSVVRFYPYGDTLAIAAAEASAPDWQSLTIPFDNPAAPVGRLTFIRQGGSPLPAPLLEAATDQIALLLMQEALTQRAEEAETKARQRISEVATIYEIGQAIDPVELPRLLQMITDRTALLMDAQACSLMLVDGEAGRLRVVASHGLPDDAQSLGPRIGEGVAGRVAQTEQPMLIVDAAQDPRLKGISIKPDIGSSMLVPMKDQAGRVLGVLAIRRRRPAQDFTDDDLKLFSVFATQAALAVTNVRLYDNLNRRANELLKLSSLSRVLISTLNLDELLGRVADDICKVVGFQRCCLYMRESRTVLQPRTWRGYGETITRLPIREGEGILGLTAKNREMIRFDVRSPMPPEQERDRYTLQLRGFARSLGTNAFVALPIMGSRDSCIGVLLADTKSRRLPITEEQINLLSVFVNQAGIAIENARLVEEMQENYRNLHRLKNYTDNVLRSIGSAIISTDARGHIARFNRVAMEILAPQGGTLQDIPLQEALAALHLPPDEYARLAEAMQKVQETGERMHLHKFTLHPIERPPLTLNLALSRLVDHNNERAGVVLIFEDITLEVQMEAELEKMRRLADIGQLAAKMAHEVRNALSPIRGAAQLLRTDVMAQSGSAEWLDIILAEVEGLKRLTGEMLDFARPTPLDPRLLDVNEFVHNAVLLLSDFLNEHRVTLAWELADNLSVLQADPIQLGQVVRNIVMNAAQAMPDGGVLHVETSCDTATELIGIHFRDTGVGIAPEEIERIFRPFVTTRPKGTGLGLPIVQKIVEKHGGRVDVVSAPEQGTTFSVWLPVSPPETSRERFYDETPLISASPTGRFPDN